MLNWGDVRQLSDANGQLINPGEEDSPNIAWTARSVLVGGSATRLDTPLADRKAVGIVNNSGLNLYLGPTAAVTVATGLPLGSSQSIELMFGPGLAVWGINGDPPLPAPPTRDIRVTEVA